MDEPIPAIRLDDLAAPRFSPEAAEIMALGAALADDVAIEPGRIMADAVAGTGGLHDFGPDGWQEPLEVLCRAFVAEGGLSRFGTVSVHAQLVQFLKNRLLVAALLRPLPGDPGHPGPRGRSSSPACPGPARRTCTT